MNNRSSVTHNIVTHQQNSVSAAITVGTLDKKVTNKRKGIGEMVDICRNFGSRTNQDYAKALERNPHVFKRHNGVFSHLYDSAHRFGESKPFKV